jgi:hypothetical protein
MKPKILLTSFASVLLFSNATFAQLDSAIFTSSGNFQVPAGVTSITIVVIGAGGNGGANGGGGAYAKGVYAVTPLTSYNVVVGSSGGGATSVAPFISATGGINGFTPSGSSIGGGGSGGVGSGGTLANY